MTKEDEMEIQCQLTELIAEAREKYLWIHCNYHDLWFSPNELEKCNAEGKYLWAKVNWTLKDPQVLVEIDEERIANLTKSLQGLKDRIETGWRPPLRRGDIFDMERWAAEEGLPDCACAPGENPQRLSVGEIRRRCSEIRMCPGIDGQLEAMSP